ncbi:MAG: tetratricopeptide repeat protein [Fidelibacterota bacterium]
MQTKEKRLIVLVSLFLSGCLVNQSVEPESPVEAVEEKGEIPEINTRALEHFMNGEFLMMQQKYALAILEYQDALKYDSGAADILASLAKAYLHLGKTSNAEAALLEALSSDPLHEEVRNLLGKFYLMKEDLPKAEEHYWMLKSTYPDKIEYSYILAELALRKGEKQKARDQFRAIFDQDNSETTALVRAAELSAEMGDLEYAFDAYRLLVNQEPRNLGYWQNFSELAVILRKLDQAIAGLENVVSLSSNNSTESLKMLAVLYYENENYEKADSILTNLYIRGHKDSQTLYYLGLISLQKEDYQAMEAFSLEMKDSYPDDLEGYTNLALAYINQEKPLEAIGVLLQARNLFPDDFSVNYLLGSSYSMEKNYLLAKMSLQTALEISPDSRTTKHLLATVLNYLKEWEDMDKLYEELLAGNADDSQALNNYSYALAERGINLEKALEMANRAIQLEPNNAAYLDTVGWIYFRMGFFNKAKNFIDRSLEIEGDSEVVQEHLNEILKFLVTEPNKIGLENSTNSQ